MVRRPVIMRLILIGLWRLVFGSPRCCHHDAVDGIIAKRFDMQTEAGAYLIRRQGALVSVAIALGHEGFCRRGCYFGVFRDDLIVGGALLFHTLTQSQMTPLMISKVNTVFRSWGYNRIGGVWFRPRYATP